MTPFRTFSALTLAAASLGTALLAAQPAAAQYYRGYSVEPDYEEPAYQRRGYGPPPGYYGERRGYEQQRGYEQPRGYGGQRGGYGGQPGYAGPGGVYFDKETAKRNARALKEQQKRAIKGGYAVPQAAPQQQYRGAPQQAAPGGPRVLYGPRAGFDPNSATDDRRPN